MDDTRQRILAATHRLLKARGLARLTSRAIAQESGFAEGTIFKHFGSKDRLLLTVIREQIPAFTAVASAGPGRLGTVRENLIQIGLAAVAYTEALIPIAAASWPTPTCSPASARCCPPTGQLETTSTSPTTSRPSSSLAG